MKQSIVSAVAALAFFSLAASASAQQHHGTSSSMPGHSGQMTDAQILPEQCRTAAADMTQGQSMGGGMPDMQGMSMQNMTDAQKGYMDAMDKMHRPMMTGIRAKDPDVSFVCGMIAHHQGAIEMAKVVLKYGNNAEAKRMAETVIKDQSKEIEEMTAWLKKNTKKELQ